MKKPKRAKLVSAGGFYRFIPLDDLTAKIQVPVARRVSISEPDVDYSETWHFTLVFALQKVTKSFAVYEQVDAIKLKHVTAN